MASQADRKRVPLKHKFVVEFGSGAGQNMRVRTLGLTFRGKLSRATLAASGHPAEWGEKMGRMPDIPGVRLTVDCSKKTVTMVDPLNADTIKDPAEKKKQERVSAQINAVLDGANLPKGSSDASNSEMKIDDDTLVTLCAELSRIRDSNCLKVVLGEIPTEKDLVNAPGEELNDPGSFSQTKAKYKKDHGRRVAKWEEAGTV